VSIHSRSTSLGEKEVGDQKETASGQEEENVFRKRMMSPSTPWSQPSDVNHASFLKLKNYDTFKDYYDKLKDYDSVD